MPEGGADDAFLRAAAAQLRERFGIAHMTLQVVREPFSDACALPAADPARPAGGAQAGSAHHAH